MRVVQRSTAATTPWLTFVERKLHRRLAWIVTCLTIAGPFMLSSSLSGQEVRLHGASFSKRVVASFRKNTAREVCVPKT